MDSGPTLMVVIGGANIIALGTLVFQAGGIVSKIKTLVIDVERLTREVALLKLKVVRLESLIDRRRSPRDTDPSFELSM